MIKLVTGEGISITVPESNSLYKALSRFVGEVFVVESSEEKQEETAKEVETAPVRYYLQEDTEAVDVKVDEYYSGLKNVFPDEKSVVRSILNNHANRFFGASEQTKVARYLAVADTLGQEYILLARVIDNKPAYISVARELVTRV